jgi:hypothetical protein
MKLAIKYNSTIKVYEGQPDYQLLQTFILQQFNLKTNFTLTYVDEEKDIISITSNTDLDNLKELNQHKKITVLSLQPETNI